MTRVVRFHRTGGPEVLQFDDLDIGDPGPGEVRVRIEAIGLNRAEALFRAGTYIEKPKLPARLGYEASATVISWGEGVTGYQARQAVNVIPAFSMNNYGVYAEEAIVPAMALVRRAPGLNAIEAAAVWMANLTAGRSSRLEILTPVTPLSSRPRPQALASLQFKSRIANGLYPLPSPGLA